MNRIKHSTIEELPVSHNPGSGEFEFFRRKFIPFGEANNTLVYIYEVPPGKSAFPYHFHHKNEETFYILSGRGILKTPEGEKTVCAGDLLFFPVGPEGAHKLTNVSDSENLVYIDFDVVHDVDIAEYPDSGKIGIWGKGINRVYRTDENVGYYDGE